MKADVALVELELQLGQLRGQLPTDVQSLSPLGVGRPVRRNARRPLRHVRRGWASPLRLQHLEGLPVLLQLGAALFKQCLGRLHFSLDGGGPVLCPFELGPGVLDLALKLEDLARGLVQLPVEAASHRRLGGGGPQTLSASELLK
eukprot:5728489-Lingulodinium_polyedra.AAC.1